MFITLKTSRKLQPEVVYKIGYFRFWLMPAPVLRSVIAAGLETEKMDFAIEQSVTFMEERLASLDKVCYYPR